MSFVKATKEQSRLRLAFVAPSGFGKTFSALAVGEHLARLKQRNGRVAVIDSEMGSAAKYADAFDFDTMELKKPFTPQKYIDALKAGDEYDVIIIDSISHLWEGEGGELDMVDAAAKRSKTGNTFTAWRDVTPFHRKFIDAILSSPAHVICTMRAKTEYVLETNQHGKMSPKKIGTKPIQREGMEYEFDVVGDMDSEHNFIVSKTRCPAIDQGVFNKPGEEFTAHLIKWITSGSPAPEKKQPTQAPRTTAANLPTIDTESTPAAVSNLTDGTGSSCTEDPPPGNPVSSITTVDEMKAIFKEFQGAPAMKSIEEVREFFPVKGCSFKDVPESAYDEIVKAIHAEYERCKFFPPPIISKQFEAVNNIPF